MLDNNTNSSISDYLKLGDLPKFLAQKSIEAPTGIIEFNQIEQVHDHQNFNLIPEFLKELEASESVLLEVNKSGTLKLYRGIIVVQLNVFLLEGAARVGQILQIGRNPDEFWETQRPPSGKVKLNETVEQGARREILEELGLTVSTFHLAVVNPPKIEISNGKFSRARTSYLGIPTITVLFETNVSISNKTQCLKPESSTSDKFAVFPLRGLKELEPWDEFLYAHKHYPMSLNKLEGKC